MQSILILNPKGGSGKSTLAINLAAWLAGQGRRVALADLDKQGSSNDWLAVRPDDRPRIIRACDDSKTVRIDADTEYLIIDSPASLHGKRLAKFASNAERALVPITASAIDVRAAERFFEELVSLKKKINRRIRLATVANRVREDTRAAQKLENYLEHLSLPDGRKLPYLTRLRQSQNYVKAAELGLGIFEMAPSKTVYDRKQWQPILKWLDRR
ncbi:MAG: ParA family protein [Gammaproteobacteria bacterium]|nr:ParA family protein [Gammaproteobacteria bacterium]